MQIKDKPHWYKQYTTNSCSCKHQLQLTAARLPTTLLCKLQVFQDLEKKHMTVMR